MMNETFQEMDKRIKKLTNEDLKTVWSCIEYCDDERWAEIVYSELGIRGICAITIPNYKPNDLGELNYGF